MFGCMNCIVYTTLIIIPVKQCVNFIKKISFYPWSNGRMRWEIFIGFICLTHLTLGALFVGWISLYNSLLMYILACVLFTDMIVQMFTQFMHTQGKVMGLFHQKKIYFMCVCVCVCFIFSF